MPASATTSTAAPSTSGGETSRLLEKPLTRAQLRPQASPRLQWSAAVAAYADLLRGGTHVGKFGWNDVRALAAGAKGEDRWGYRAEFLELVDRARALRAFERVGDSDVVHPSGSGIGLAVVRELMEAMRGEVFLEDSPLGGLRVRLRLRSVDTAELDAAPPVPVSNP